jgi:hypothetical protein
MSETAIVLGISRATLYRMKDAGDMRLTTRGRGGLPAVDAAEVRRLLNLRKETFDGSRRPPPETERAV